MVIEIIGTLIAVIVVTAVVYLIIPATFAITRTITVHTPPAIVFEQVNDFHKWAAWSPWENLDPTMQRSFSGPQAGPGAVYTWTGNKRVGEGTMTITDVNLPERIVIGLKFRRPFKANNTATFTFKPQGNQTFVTWTMTGNKNAVSKVMGLVMNMDKLVGSEFSKGLENLKRVSEAAARA